MKMMDFEIVKVSEEKSDSNFLAYISLGFKGNFSKCLKKIQVLYKSMTSKSIRVRISEEDEFLGNLR